MSIFEALEPLLEAIPKEEHALLQRFLRYQLTVLSLMPPQQRYLEYGKAEKALKHYEEYAYPKRPEHG